MKSSELESNVSSPTAAPVHFAQVADLLMLEAETIRGAVERLDPEEVDRAIALLAGCEGKVILMGVGKSGMIAHKIAATLTSTGTAAIYLHASDALHGDLGIVAAKDVAIILSNSGETEELIAALPHLKRRHVPVIAVVGNVRSTLARNATVILNAHAPREACPLGLAPTTSTTLALAIGDAIAMTLMHVKKISAEDFALNHPAGRLGKRLTLHVEDLMHKGEDNPTVTIDATWIEIISAIGKGGLGAVTVADTDAKLVGIITDGDVRRIIQKIKLSDLESLKAAEMMTPDPVAVAPEMLAYDALKLMENRTSQISVLPVTDNFRRCIGLLRVHDIVRNGL